MGGTGSNEIGRLNRFSASKNGISYVFDTLKGLCTKSSNPNETKMEMMISLKSILSSSIPLEPLCTVVGDKRERIQGWGAESFAPPHLIKKLLSPNWYPNCLNQGRIQNLAQGGQTFGARSAPKIFAPPRVFFAPPGGGAKSTPGGAKFFVALCYDYYTPSGSK